MNLNKQINPKSSGLSREDIATYHSTGDEQVKHAIEKEVLENDFESDALEGWTESSLNSASMKRLDKHFHKSSNWIYWITGVLSVILIAWLFLFSNMNENKLKLISKNDLRSVTVEKSDIVLPEAIEAMEELPSKEQITVKTIVNDFSEQLKETKTDRIQEQEVEKLEFKKIEETKISATIINDAFVGKEIYFSDLKLLDYRVYRSKPKIVTKQMILTGTPANIGDEASSEEETLWKDVEIPYIDYLEKTMEFFSKGQNKKALTRFTIILESYPDDLNANFYAGLCYYNLKDFSSSINSFKNCQNSKYSNFSEEAEWYLAKSLLANGEKHEAKKLFEIISNSKSYYSSQAKKIVSSL